MVPICWRKGGLPAKLHGSRAAGVMPVLHPPISPGVLRVCASNIVRLSEMVNYFIREGSWGICWWISSRSFVRGDLGVAGSVLSRVGPPDVINGAGFRSVAINAGQLRPSVVDATPTNEHVKNFLGFTSFCTAHRYLNNVGLQRKCLTPKTNLQ